MRSCLLLVVLLLTQASFADTKLYLEDFTIASGETKEVSLILENDAPATALQVSIDLPTGLKYVKDSAEKTNRVKGRGAVVQSSYSTETGKLVIVETDGTIAAGEGAIITFKVQAGDDLDGGTKPVELSNIIVSDANGDQLNENESYTATAKYLGLDCKFTAPESLEVSVGKEYQVDVTMTNVQSLTAFQGTLTLPEGLEIVVPDADEPSELFIYSDRIPMTNQFKFQKGESSISFVLSSTMNSEIVGNDGVIFSFKVKATEVLAEESEISLTNMYVATTTGKSQLCDPVTISVKNTSVADKAAFDEYKAEQTAAVEALAEEGDSEASQQIIAKAVAAIEALEYDEEKTLDENKAAVDAAVAPVAEALAEQRAADEAAAKAAANEAAYTTLKAQYDELRAALRQAKNTIKSDYADVAAQFDDAIADIEDMLSDAIAKLEGEYAAGKLTAESQLQNGEAIAAGIEKLLADAAAAQLAAYKAAFDTYKSEQTAAVEALAEEGDSEASQQIIANAVAAIEALEYDEALTLDENKAAVDAVVAPVADALAEQRAADAIIPGDTNGDGEVNTVDASYILMYLVGNVPADFVEAAADVDGNGRIDTLDATAILKKLVE